MARGELAAQSAISGKTAMAAVEGNDKFVLTKAQSTQLRGGGGRGDHGKATSEMASMFLQWRARTAMAMLGRQWRTALARRCERREMRNGAATRSGRRWVASRRGWPCQGVHGAWPARSGERRRVAPRGQRTLTQSAMTVTDRFQKTVIQSLTTMTDSVG